MTNAPRDEMPWFTLALNLALVIMGLLLMYDAMSPFIRF